MYSRIFITRVGTRIHAIGYVFVNEKISNREQTSINIFEKKAAIIFEHFSVFVYYSYVLVLQNEQILKV